MKNKFSSRRLIPYSFKKTSVLLAVIPVLVFFFAVVTGSLPYNLYCEIDGLSFSNNWLGLFSSHFIAEGVSSLLLVILVFLILGLNIEERLGTALFLITLFFVSILSLLLARVVTGYWTGSGFLFCGPYLFIFILIFLNPFLFPEEDIQFIGMVKMKSWVISFILGLWAFILLWINRGKFSLILVPLVFLILIPYSSFILKLDLFYFFRSNKKDYPF